MTQFNELKKYVDYQFSTGCYAGNDYKIFQNKYINYLKNMCEANNWQLVNICRNHYCFSVFIKSDNGKYAYLSISDVRYNKNDWYKHILIRTAKSEKDYTGGWNNYTPLDNLENRIKLMLK